MTDSSSAFIVPSDYSTEWRDITLTNRRVHTCVYTATRYGRRFLLKALPPEDDKLADFRLQQEQEFQAGIQLVHPNIAATYSLEEVKGVGRCIVQEWIDGVTLGEWLQTQPARAARERVFLQLLDALEYLHGLQLVHHDIKADNILITRNGTNVKLIDFGLSASDATLMPVPNDQQADIAALKRLFPSFVPNGQFGNIAALRRAIRQRKRLVRLLPILLSVLLLALAVTLFYLSWKERHAEQQRLEDMCAIVDALIERDREVLTEFVNRPDTFDTYSAYINEYKSVVERQLSIRDSVYATYKENNILRDLFMGRWSLKNAELNNEFLPQILGKGTKLQTAL